MARAGARLRRDDGRRWPASACPCRRRSGRRSPCPGPGRRRRRSGPSGSRPARARRAGVAVHALARVLDDVAWPGPSRPSAATGSTATLPPPQLATSRLRPSLSSARWQGAGAHRRLLVDQLQLAGGGVDGKGADRAAGLPSNSCDLVDREQQPPLGHPSPGTPGSGVSAASPSGTRVMFCETSSPWSAGERRRCPCSRPW